LDKSRGVIATLLVQNGTLHAGDILVAGASSGKIKAMFDDHGESLKVATPSMPVAVLGLSDVPAPGDLFRVVPSDREARLIVAQRKLDQKAASAKPEKTMSLEQVFAKFQAGEAKELALIVKADVQGSLEPIVGQLEKLTVGTGPRVNVLYAETGNVTENDVMLATASNAIIIGFSVAVDTAAQRLAETNGVSIRQYDIIYRVTEDIEKALSGCWSPSTSRWSSARPRCGRCSRSAGWATLPAAWCGRASCAAMPRRASSARAPSCSKAMCPRSSTTKTTCAKSRRASSAASA
jgi:translation initiation factor IF-2